MNKIFLFPIIFILILISILCILLLLALINHLKTIKINKNNKWKINKIQHSLEKKNNKIKFFVKSNVLKNNLNFLRFTKNLLEKNNIEFWIECGTLLGAVRHKGFIPWDDDIDIHCWRKDEKKLEKILKKLPKNISYIKCCGGYKIFNNNFYKNPRIDIYIIDFDIKENCYGYCHPIVKKKCSFYQQIQSPSACYPLDYILPLKKLKFEDIELPVPNKYMKIIQKRYSNNWKKYKISNLQSFQHSFSFLIPILPFVEKIFGKSFFKGFENINNDWK